MMLDPIKSATEMVKQVRVSSVLSSLLFILPFLFAALVVVSFTENVVVQAFFMWSIGIILGVLLITFLGVLLFGDRRLLQSEDHLFRMKALELIGDQSHSYKDIETTALENNPELPNPSTASDPKLPDGASNANSHE